MTDANEAGRETPRSINLSARLARLSPEQRATFDRLLRERGKAAEATGLTRFTRSSRASADPARTSYAQERLWFWEQLRPGQSSYNVSAARRMIGVLDVAALRSALGTIVARHESLRTTIVEWQGEPRQIVAPPVPADAFPLVVEDEPVHDPATTTWLDHAIREPFDLAAGVLYRVRLWRCGPRAHVLLIVMHHAISDGSSFGVLWHELELLYAAYATGADAAATALPSLPIQYVDYAEWQREWMAGGELDRQLAYWRHHLEDAPNVLTLPTDRPRLATQQFRGGRRVASLETALVAALRSLARNENATLFMVLLAGFEALVARYSGQSDFLIGVPMTNRPRPELQALIGFFVNMLPMRATVSGAATGRDLVRRVRATATDAYAHQDIPFERLVDALQPERDLSRMPLVQVAFQLQSFGIDRPSLAGLTTQSLETWNGQARFDLEVSAVEDAATDDVRLTVVYDADLFDASTIDRLCRHYEAVLAALASAPDASVADIPLLSAAERMQLLREWGLPRHVDRVPECVHASFEAQAARAPDAIAIVAENANGDLESLSYAELNRRANRLANVLRRLGVAPESRVAFSLERTPSLPVALLGIVKAGGAYVPLDPSYPVDRLRYMLADSAPRLLLTSRRRGARVPWTELVDGLGVEIVDIDELEARGRLEPDDDASLADVAVTPEHLAYVIYTSGSTGRPKGSLIPHRSIGGYVDEYLELRDGPRAETWLQYSSLSWDASTLELWAPLLRGGRCVLCPPSADIESNIDALGALIAAHRVTTLWMTAALFDVVIDTAPEMLLPLEVLIIGGQQLSPVHVARAKERLGRTRLVNGYGPSECTVFSTCHVFSDDEIRAPIPIGRPVGDRRCYVIDGSGEPTPLGVTGELCIGGAGVARGYLNRAALTAERFIPDPFGPSGSRLYRSGDFARWRADGEIEYLGRADAQVKIRGFRVELGEIEALLSMRHDVRQAVVIARPSANRDPQLVAYCVPTVEHAARIRSEDLRDFLSTRLPTYMVPAAYVVLDALPFTANGKLDRRALPAPDEAAFAVSQYEAPASATERRLADVWSALLGVERVGRRDDFFALGGHSLLAVQLMSRLRQMLGVDVTVATLFRAPVLADLAAQVEAARRVEARPIVPVDRDQRGVPIGAPLSFAQRRLWFLEQLGGLGPAYHVPWAARLVGALDVAALERALTRIVARHEALRTTYQSVDGVPRQVVTPASEAAFALATTNLSAVGEAERHGALRASAIADATAPFDLERGALVRGRLVRLGAAEHVLLLTMHHIVCDGWSLSVFSAELSALYAAARSQSSSSREIDPLPPLAIQYADYAAWQMQAADEPALRAQAAYWLSTLSGAPNRLELPTDRPRPAMHSYAGALVPLALDEALTAKLAALSARFETTMFMTVLAGWAAVLSRLSGQSDVVIGTPAANRTRTEVEGLIGFFVNTLALRIDLSGGPTVRDLLTRVRDRALEAQEHQDVPFEQVVELLQPTRHLSQSAVFQTLFVWQNTPPVRFTMPDLSATLLPGLSAGADVVGAVDADTIGRAVSRGHVPAKFDVTLTLREDGARLTGHLVYATALWERTTIERYAGYLTRVLTAMTADPEVRVAELPLLDAGELARVLEEWNPAVPAAGVDELDTTVPCIHERFEAHVRRTPDAVAAVYGDEQLTYAELDARAANLACRLAALGVRPETRVALCLERSLALVIGLLGVLKAGGAYVPLDPKSPAERLRFMVDDSAPVALLTDAASEAATHGVSGGRPVLRIDASSSSQDESRDSAAATRDIDSSKTQELASRQSTAATGSADQLCYVIYTSGSTGGPKGVLVTHRQLWHYVAGVRARLGLDESDAAPLHYALVQPVTFDSVMTLFWLALGSGGTLHVISADDAVRPESVAAYAHTHAIDVLKLTPSHLAMLLSGAREPRGILPRRCLILGGEGMQQTWASDVCRLVPTGCTVFNHYGPTEATVGVLVHGLQPPEGLEADESTWTDSEREGNVPLGRPLPFVRVYVLDRAGSGEPVPIGVTGDLYVGGLQVARGYLNRAALTAERFVPDQFGPRGSRLYRTGDLARWRRDGAIEFLGRADFQVKVRGYRIEVGEIEAVLAAHPAVEQAIVLARPPTPGTTTPASPGELQLVAYYIETPAATADTETLRTYLSERLPAYMVPAAYMRLGAFPLMSNGKVDRKALPAPDHSAYATGAYEAPVGDLEQTLSELWSEIVRVDRVGRWDDFFTLGGHSLSAVRVITHLRDRFDIDLPVRAIFTHSTVAALSREIERLIYADVADMSEAEARRALDRESR